MFRSYWAMLTQNSEQSLCRVRFRIAKNSDRRVGSKSGSTNSAGIRTFSGKFQGFDTVYEIQYDGS